MLGGAAVADEDVELVGVFLGGDEGSLLTLEFVLPAFGEGAEVFAVDGPDSFAGFEGDDEALGGVVVIGVLGKAQEGGAGGEGCGEELRFDEAFHGEIIGEGRRGLFGV